MQLRVEIQDVKKTIEKAMKSRVLGVAGKFNEGNLKPIQK
jgi:hypothetical protein